MCRLFGLNAGRAEVSVKYWLESAPDSMAAQSTRNTSGAGVGWFDRSDQPMLVKSPDPLHESTELTADASDIRAHTVVTHVRMATTGADTVENTHPFLVDGLLVAHNGGFGDLEKVDEHLGSALSLVKGQTDSERYAALIAKETRAHGGDVGAGLRAAAQWLSQNVPLYSLNAVVIRDGQLWALRYPDERALHLARRVIPRRGRDAADGAPDASWSGSSSVADHQVTARSDTPVVVVASERIDGTDNWRMLEPGELIAVDDELTVTSTLALDKAPASLLHLAEKDPNDESF